jgi:hypothetical protein
MVVLAVVIVIALILIAILGEFPGVGGAARKRGSSAFWQSSVIGIPSYAISEDGSGDDVTLKIRNNMKDSITINSIAFNSIEVYNTTNVLASGESKYINIDNAGDYCVSEGSTYSVHIKITYIEGETGQTFTYLGDGNKLEGTCAS